MTTGPVTTGPVTAGPAGVGVVGAGAISDQYLASLALAPDVRVVAIADLDGRRAAAQAAGHGIRVAVDAVDLLLAEPDVEVVVNLTVPAAHAEVSRAAIEAGRHVWSEKPLALTRDDARALLDAASARGVAIGCAPDTLLAPGAQLTQRLIAEDAIGRPVSALALVQNPGPESWHPNPAFLFGRGAGPLFDLGPYYLQALVQHLGPIAEVTARSSTARATRTIGSGPLAGTAFPVTVPTQYSVLLALHSGASAVLVASFESEVERSVLEVTGADGAIVPPQPTEFVGAPTLLRGGLDAETPPLDRTALGRGVGVVELARAVRAGRPPRAGADLAFHLLDVMLSIEESARDGRTVTVQSSCRSPDLLPAGWDPRAATL